MKRSLLLSTAVLLLAAVFRLWQISTLPPGLHSDEAFHLLNAQLITRGQSFPAYITGNNGNDNLALCRVDGPVYDKNISVANSAWLERIAIHSHKKGGNLIGYEQLVEIQAFF